VRPRFLILAAAVAVVTTVNSPAKLGWTLDQTVKAYGQPPSGPETYPTLGQGVYFFEFDGYQIATIFTYGRMSTSATGYTLIRTPKMF
jgi:hypothetical protein